MNRKFFLLLLVLSSTIYTYGQDSTLINSGKKNIIIYDPHLEPQSKNHVELFASGYTGYKYPSESIVVIDNKIYDASSLLVRRMRVSDFEFVQQIIDSASKSAVKKITIYKSKKNN